MNATPAADKQSWHLGQLDALRGIAVLGVIAVHCGEHTALPWFWAQLARNGQRGVQLFFLVSAFTLLLSHESRRRAELHPVRNFFVRRIFRLTPMYYVTIGLTAWLLPEVLGGWRSAVLGAAFIQGVSPFAMAHVAPGAWSLTDEAAFYLCLPLLTLYIRSLRHALLTLLLGTPAVLLLSFFFARLNPQNYEFFSFLWFPIELPVFLLGIAVYFFWKEWIVTGRLCSPARARTTSAYFLLGFLLLLATNIPTHNRKLYLSTLGWALLLVAVLLHRWPLLVNRVTIFLGKISFSLYLLHAFFLTWVSKQLSGQSAGLSGLARHPRQAFLLLFIADLLLTTLAASLTWLYVEETGIRLGRRLIAQLENRALRRRAISLPLSASALLDETNSADAQF